MAIELHEEFVLKKKLAVPFRRIDSLQLLEGFGRDFFLEAFHVEIFVFWDPSY